MIQRAYFEKLRCKDVAPIDRYLKEAGRDFPQNKISYFDYMTDPRFSPEDFEDGDHLSSRGAAKFTRYFDQEAVSTVLSPLARNVTGGVPNETH